MHDLTAKQNAVQVCQIGTILQYLYDFLNVVQGILVLIILIVFEEFEKSCK